jgi:hypothetical protein
MVLTSSGSLNTGIALRYATPGCNVPFDSNITGQKVPNFTKSLFSSMLYVQGVLLGKFPFCK